MMIDKGSLILVLDGAKLLLFRNAGTAVHPDLQTLKHETAEDPPSRAIGSDSPGRVHPSQGTHGSSYDETDWHRQAEERFARHGAEVLEAAALADPEAAIVVIAPPRTLGEIRKHYGRASQARLAGEIDKDLAGHVTDDIVRAIAAHEG